MSNRARSFSEKFMAALEDAFDRTGGQSRMVDAMGRNEWAMKGGRRGGSEEEEEVESPPPDPGAQSFSEKFMSMLEDAFDRMGGQSRMADAIGRNEGAMSRGRSLDSSAPSPKVLGKAVAAAVTEAKTASASAPTIPGYSEAMRKAKAIRARESAERRAERRAEKRSKPAAPPPAMPDMNMPKQFQMAPEEAPEKMFASSRPSIRDVPVQGRPRLDTTSVLEAPVVPRDTEEALRRKRRPARRMAQIDV